MSKTKAREASCAGTTYRYLECLVESARALLVEGKYGWDQSFPLVPTSVDWRVSSRPSSRVRVYNRPAGPRLCGRRPFDARRRPFSEVASPHVVDAAVSTRLGLPSGERVLVGYARAFGTFEGKVNEEQGEIHDGTYEREAIGRQEHAADGQGEERYDRAAHPRQPFGARGTGRAPTTCDSRSAERGDAGGQDYEGDYAVKRHGPAESEVSELQPHWTRIVDLLRGRGVRCRHRRPLKGQTRSRQRGTANVRAGRQAARWPALTGMTTAGSWRCGGARRSKRWGASSRSAW